MNLKRHSLISTVIGAALLFGGTATAQAQDESLLSVLDDTTVSGLLNPAVTLACFPSGQVGSGNTFTGTQNVNCSQSATATTPGTSTDTGYVLLTERHHCEAGATCVATLQCPEGKQATGGGVTYDNISDLRPYISSSGPSPQGTDSGRVWRIVIVNPGTGAIDWWATVTCVNAPEGT
ncbi:hypothetical protein [Streptomyces sp. NPDC046727]|uniref:hypothetical protein n=1 Tax=Streptomyces sp. NPDC046727 TaxID=3155373 RepID=UPI0033FD060A